MLKKYLYWSIVLDKHHLGCNLRLNSFSSFEGKLFRYVRRAFFTIMEMDMGSSYEPKTIILWNHFRLSKKIIYLNILQQHIFLRIFGGGGGEAEFFHQMAHFLVEHMIQINVSSIKKKLLNLWLVSHFVENILTIHDIATLRPNMEFNYI